MRKYVKTVEQYKAIYAKAEYTLSLRPFTHNNYV